MSHSARTAPGYAPGAAMACPEIAVERGLLLEMEIHRGEVPATPLYCEDVTYAVGDLVDEAFSTGILSGAIPTDASQISVCVDPIWTEEPRVDAVEVTLIAQGGSGAPAVHVQRFQTGRWNRSAITQVAALRVDGVLGEDEGVSIRLTACPSATADMSVPPLYPPEIFDRSLEEFGMRELGAGGLLADRPVLMDSRMVDELTERTIRAGPAEIGAATLGMLLRLPEPLPGTSTRIVTLLTACIFDQRHDGQPARVTLDPGALAEAAHVAELRGLGERVVTATHSHGWGTGCDNCNQELCHLPTCTTVSIDDYVVLESLFPSKTTVLPIAGRKPGAPGRRPVLEVHAWRSGQVLPIPWRRFDT